MDQIALAFLDKSSRLLTDDYLPKIERCLDRLDDADVWWRPNEASNSIGNLVLHLCGNVTMWILGGVGRLPFERNRQQEFDERHHISSEELRGRLRQVVKDAVEVVRRVSSEELITRRRIQGYDVSVLEAVYHVVEHFAMHTGQIIVISKARAGIDLKLWEAPSP